MSFERGIQNAGRDDAGELKDARDEAFQRSTDQEADLLLRLFEDHYSRFGCNSKHTDLPPDFSIAALWKAKQQFRQLRHPGYDVVLDFGWFTPAFMIWKYDW